MRPVVSMICEVATRACLSMSLYVSSSCHKYCSCLLCWSLWITTLDGSLLCSPYLHFACSLLFSPILPIQCPAFPTPHRKRFMVGIGSGTFLHWSSFNVMVLVGYLLRAVVVSNAWHAHVVPQSHGFTGWRSCRFSCAALPSWLAFPSLLSFFFLLLVSVTGLDSWHWGSWLGCRDLQLSLFFLLLVSVTGAWTPGMGAHGLVAGISSHRSATWFRGWLAGFQREPLDIPSTQPLLL